MALSPVVVFAASVAINLIFKLLTPKFGGFRRGIDTVLFCSVYIGYTAGSYQGALYGILIAITYYVFRSTGWVYSVFVIPINGFIGYLAGIFAGMDLMILGNLLFVVYHALTFIVVGIILRRAELKYLAFIVFNYISTIVLLRIALLL